MPFVAGVDCSTQSSTVEIYDDTGRAVGIGRTPHPVTTPPVSEQDPQAWWAAFVIAFGQACAAAGIAGREVRAISVGAQCHGLVALDEAGAVIRPAKLWNDTTSAPQTPRLIEALGAAEWARVTGLVPNPAHTITKLAWLRDNEPEHLARLRTVLVPHDWMTFRLTGERVTDRSDASGTGYYQSVGDRWRTDLLAELVGPQVDWAAAMPRVLGPNEAAGTVVPSVAAELGLAPGVVVGPGGGDQHVAAIGMGLRTGDVAYSLGTSGVVLAVSDYPVFDESGLVDGVADATGGFLPLICTLNCTKVTDTFARLLGVDPAGLGELALAADPRAARPVLAAYLDGERTPRLPGATGLLTGITNACGRESLALAVFEGVVHGLVRGHRAIDALGVDTAGTVLAVGGGARSPAYRQLIADALQRPVQTRAAPEAVTRGAAVQAATVLLGGDVRAMRDAWRPETVSVVEPRRGADPALMAAYLATAELAAAAR